MSILQMSISAGVLVIAIVLIRAVALNRLPKKMFLVLWCVALVRLLVPVAIPLPFSVPNIIPAISNKVLPETAELPVTDDSIYNVYTGVPATGYTSDPITAEQIIEATQEPILNVNPAIVIWLAGMLAAFIVFAVIYYKNHKGLRFATLIRDSDYLNNWLTEHRLTRSISIMQTDRIISPLSAGIIKPRIILPINTDMSDNQLLDYVLTHEYYHIKRYDALWKMLLVFASCVHWFNPLVWVMFILVNRDLELTCDEMVIRRFGAETKTAYAYTLIGMAEQRSKFAPLYNGFSRNATEERIESIMKIKKKSLISIVLAFVLVSALTLGVLAVSASSSTLDNDTAIFKGDDGLVTINAYTFDDTKIYEVSDGTIIITEHLVGRYLKGEYDIIINGDINTIKLTNGTIINVPINTRIDFDEKSGEISVITIGDGDAVITTPEEARTMVSAGAVIEINGQRIQLVRPAGRFIINEDGSLTEAPDEYVDRIYDSYNISSSPFASEFSREGGEATTVFLLPEEYNPYAAPHIALSTYTNEEMAQIIADIESGKIPITGRFKEDGTFEFYNLPEEMAGRSLEDAEITVNFTILDKELIEHNSNASGNHSSYDLVLLSVKRSDENKFTAEEWTHILEQIEKGEIFWED